MRNFAYDIQLGFLAFPLVALLLALPYALYQYRRFGAISVWKTFVVFTFILYCLCAVSLIVFPLPKDPSHIVEIAQTPQLQPFHVIEQIRETTDFSLGDRSTWGPALREKVVYEAIFNVMLTVPLGAYLCYLFRCRWWMALLIGFATTLTFETSQLTGLFGIYEHPYRLFDVDDLILNTTGTMLGFWLMIPLAWALPSMDEVNEQARERGSSRISLTRRTLAAIVDLTMLIVLFGLAWIALSPTDAQIAKALAVDPSRAGAKVFIFRFIGGLFADPMSALLIALGIGAVLFAVIPMASHGRTIGKAIVGIRIVATSGQDAPVCSYWMRFFASAFFLLIPIALVVLAPEEIEGVSSALLFQIVGLVAVVWIATVIARVIGSFSGRPYVSLSEVVSGTRLAPSNQAAETEGAAREAERANARATVSDDAPSTSVQDVGQTAVYQPDQQRTSPAASARAQTRSHARPQVQTRPQTPTGDDYGKQAALDSLFEVNYDEQHPVAGASANNAPTRAMPQNPDAQQDFAADLPTRQIHTPDAVSTQQLGSQAPTPAPQANPTQRIDDPNLQRKLRRDGRPDAGGTQVFKKR